MKNGRVESHSINVLSKVKKKIKLSILVSHPYRQQVDSCEIRLII